MCACAVALAAPRWYDAPLFNRKFIKKTLLFFDFFFQHWFGGLASADFYETAFAVKCSSINMGEWHFVSGGFWDTIEAESRHKNEETNIEHIGAQMTLFRWQRVRCFRANGHINQVHSTERCRFHQIWNMIDREVNREVIHCVQHIPRRKITFFNVFFFFALHWLCHRESIEKNEQR